MRRGGAGALPGGAKCGVFFVAEACIAEILGPEDAKLRSASGDYETEERGTRSASSARRGVGGVSALSFPAAGGASRRAHRAVLDEGGRAWSRAWPRRLADAGGRGRGAPRLSGKIRQARGWDGGVRGRGSALSEDSGPGVGFVPGAALDGASGSGRRGAKESVPDAAKFGASARS